MCIPKHLQVCLFMASMLLCSSVHPTNASVMSLEDKLLSMVTMVKYSGRGGLVELSQQDFLMLLDSALQTGYKPGPALLKALADQPDLLKKTQQRVKAHQ
jgi:hypothetical protein